MMARDPTRTCGREMLATLLEKHGLPSSPEIFDFEANLGGWCSTHSSSASGYGVFLSLQEGAGASLVSRELRQYAWLFESERGAVDDEGETSPLWGTGFPRAFFLDRELLPVGMLGFDILYFLGVGGEVYSWASPLDELYLVAGSGRTMLEVSGLRHHRRQTWFEVHICADVTELARDALQVSYYNPASDDVLKWWVNNDAHVCLFSDYAPCIMGTQVACKDEQRLVALMRQLKASLGVDRLRVWKGANAIDDSRGLDALSRSGTDCEILSGPGPGHGGTEYDVSLCDLKSWA